MAVPEEAQGAYELNHTLTIPMETEEEWWTRMSTIPHLLFADDAHTYVPGTMMALLMANRFNHQCDLGSARVNESWAVPNAITELLGTIEGAILLSKWAERTRLLAEVKNDGLLHALGLISTAGMTSSLCVEKAMKTLIALETTQDPTPKTHNLDALWAMLPTATQVRLEDEIASLPICWKSPPERGQRSIEAMLSISKDAFVAMRYLPEMQPTQSRSITSPLALTQVAASLFLVCIEKHKPGTLKASCPTIASQ